MRKIWRADNPYDSLTIIFGLMFGLAILNMFTVGMTPLNVIASILAFAICSLLVWQAWKIFDLDVVVNKYLFEHKCFEWVEEVTPVFWSGRLASVVVDLAQYFVTDVEGKYNVICDNVDERVNVYRYDFVGDWDRVLIVVEYQGQVDVYTNILEEEDEE